MDSEKILEILDSNWFFCSIFNPPLFSRSNRNISTTHPIDSHKSDQPTPKIPIHQKQHDQTPNSRTGIETVPKSDLSLADHGSLLMKEQRRRSKRSSKLVAKRSLQSPWMKDFQEVKGFMELGFAIEVVGLDGGWQMGEIDRSRRLPLHCRMPPLDDSIAMKEHLKSWAYAVACAVR